MRPSLYIAAAFMAAAAYEAAVALEWIHLGSDPGDGAPGEVFVIVAALGAVVATFVLAFLQPRSRVFAAIPPAAAAWTTSVHFTFDPYYLPTHIRFSDASGGISTRWIVGLLVVGAALSALALRFRHVGWGLTPLFVLVCALTVIGEGIGH